MFQHQQRQGSTQEYYCLEEDEKLGRGQVTLDFVLGTEGGGSREPWKGLEQEPELEE